MLESNSTNFAWELTTQEIFEHQITCQFEQAPLVRSLILRMFGFGVVRIIGIDPKETQVGDLAIKINHNGFGTCA